MKWGYFIGVNWQRRVLSVNSQPMVLEDFMFDKDIKNPQDVIGPFTLHRNASQLRGMLHALLQKDPVLPGIMTLMQICHQHKVVTNFWGY